MLTNQIEVMKCTAQPLDLNPIEDLWHQVELSLKHKVPFKNPDELHEANEAKVNKHIESMPKRCSMVLKSK